MTRCYTQIKLRSARALRWLRQPNVRERVLTVVLVVQAVLMVFAGGRFGLLPATCLALMGPLAALLMFSAFWRLVHTVHGALAGAALAAREVAKSALGNSLAASGDVGTVRPAVLSALCRVARVRESFILGALRARLGVVAATLVSARISAAHALAG